MAEIRSSSKIWVLIVAVVILIAGGAYLLIRNSASADVSGTTTTGSYKFEIVSKAKITPKQVGTNQYRIYDKITLGSGFAVRVRQSGSNKIVSKNIRWSATSQEGFFSLDASDSLVAYYPKTNGAHYVYAEIGSGRNITRLNLDFSTDGFNSQSPVASATIAPSSTPTTTGPTPTPTPSVVGANVPTIKAQVAGGTIVTMTGNQVYMNVGMQLVITGDWPQPVASSAISYELTCIPTASAPCDGTASSYLNLTQFSGGQSAIGLSGNSLKAGQVRIDFKSNGHIDKQIYVNISSTTGPPIPFS